MTINIVVPQIGEAISELTIVEWHKKEGDHIALGDVLFEVDSDKAIVEVDSFAEGILVKIIAPAGSAVLPQDVVAILEPVLTADDPKTTRDEEADGAGEIPPSRATPTISPVARRIAHDLGVEPALVSGSGPGKRIMVDDVKAYAQKASSLQNDGSGAASRRLVSPKARRLAQEHGINLNGIIGTGTDAMIVSRDLELPDAVEPTSMPPAVPTADHTQSLVPLSRLRQTIATRMQASKQTIPHFYLMVDVNMAAAQSLRNYCREVLGWQRPPTYTDLLVRASALALRAMPALNASFTDGGMQPHSTINIGVAVSTEAGLLVPVLPNADSRPLDEISAQVRELSDRARRGRLNPSDMTSKSMVISNLGMYGVDAFVAIIDIPDPMILAVGQIKDRLVPLDGQIAILPVCTLTLSADHRAIDGAQAAQFLQRLKSNLEQPFELLA